MNKICYCPVCCKDEEYKIERIKKYYEDGEVKFYYYEKNAICSICGEELYVDELMKENQIEFEKAYKEVGSIITNEEILTIINKYRISKRNLSLVLGLGELTITRYLDGYIPTKKISNLLKSILNSPENYYNLLIENKNNLKESVFIKSKNQVDDLLGINKNDSFIEDVAEYIIANNEETTNLVLQKLLYYVELFYMVFNNEKLFESQCKAWAHGPVYGRIYYEYKEFRKEPIEKNKEYKNFDSSLKDLIDSIIKNFGCYSGKVLSYFTHNEDPWISFSESTDQIIDKNIMIKYARLIKNDYNIKNISDISRYSVKMFEKYKECFS